MIIKRDKALVFLSTIFGFKRPGSTRQLLLVIFAHALGWVLFLTLPLWLYQLEFKYDFFLFKEVVNKLFLIGLFYLNYFYLLPRFFEKRKALHYLASLFLIMSILVLQQVVSEEIFFRYASGNNNIIPMPVRAELPFSPPLAEPDVRLVRALPDTAAVFEQRILPLENKTFFGVLHGFWIIAITNVASSGFLFVFLGAFIRLTFALIKQQDEKKELANAKLNAEVKLLKSQINPHFLFNTLNSIYAQAHARSAATEQSVLKLSHILRYVIYDSNSETIALSKDIAYITNYIELQRLRIADKVTIHYKVSGSPDQLSIAPLLLITFIENAFKYGISYVHSSVITIEIKMVGTEISLYVSNPIIQSGNNEEGGIGIKNAMSRLELLYPGKYFLNADQHDGNYTVNLKIQLS